MACTSKCLVRSVGGEVWVFDCANGGPGAGERPGAGRGAERAGSVLSIKLLVKIFMPLLPDGKILLSHTLRATSVHKILTLPIKKVVCVQNQYLLIHGSNW